MNNNISGDYACIDACGNERVINCKNKKLYVLVNNKCNARCKYCVKQGEDLLFSVRQFVDTFKNINNTFDLTEVHFVGGEPTLDMNKLEQSMAAVSVINKNVKIYVHTNGAVINELSNNRYIDHIVLSRYAIKDEDNNRIFNTKTVAQLNEIIEFRDIHKIILRCNLIKGYVDNRQELVRYLEMAASLGINKVELRSLTKLNRFCKEHFVDFNTFDLQSCESFKKIDCLGNYINEKQCCRCDNYIYSTRNISIKHEHIIKKNEAAMCLMYTEDGLTAGFADELIS